MGPDARAEDKVHLSLVPDADVLVQARRFVSLYAQQSGLDEEHTDDLVQAAAELMAISGDEHQVLGLDVHEHPDQLTVQVDFSGSIAIDPRDEAAVLLNGLSRQWGWRQLPGHTQVWCQVPRQQAAP